MLHHLQVISLHIAKPADEKPLESATLLRSPLENKKKGVKPTKAQSECLFHYESLFCFRMTFLPASQSLSPYYVFPDQNFPPLYQVMQRQHPFRTERTASPNGSLRLEPDLS